MQTKTAVQAGPLKPVLLTLAPTAVVDTLNKHINAGKVGWPSDDHFSIAQGVSMCLEDPTGNPVDFPSPLKNIFKLIFKPTEDSQMEVLCEQLRLAGYVLSPEAKATFATMLNAAQFGNFLADQINPKTGKPFITLEKKRGLKKKAFAALIPMPTPTPAEDTDEVEAPEETDEQSTDEETTDEVASEPSAKLAPAKPAPRK